MSAKPWKHVSCHGGFVSSAGASPPVCFTPRVFSSGSPLPPSLPFTTMFFSFTFQHFFFPSSPLEPIIAFLQTEWLVPCLQPLLWLCPAPGGTVHLQARQKQNPGAPAPQVKSTSLCLVFSLPNNPPYFPPVSKVQVSPAFHPIRAKNLLNTPTSEPPPTPSLYSGHSGHPSSPKALLLPLQPYRTLLQAQHSA